MNDQPAPGYAVSCQEVVEMITNYLEGALDADLTAEIEAHLGLCGGCQEYVEQMRATIRAIGHVPVTSLDETTQNELLRAFHDLHQPHPTEQG